MKRTLNDQLKTRVMVLLDRWNKQTEQVRQDIEDYMTDYNISKILISKDVSKMKETFKNIEVILKELK